MSVLDTVLDKLQFWRRRDPDDAIEGCFTLPGAELGDSGGEDCAPPDGDDLGQ